MSVDLKPNDVLKFLNHNLVRQIWLLTTTVYSVPADQFNNNN